MKREINPQDSSRAEAFGMWMISPMPMVTLVKTLLSSFSGCKMKSILPEA